MSSPYSTRYYDQLKEGSTSSARALVPIIMELFAPKSIADVGCGSGTWAKIYSEFGAEILGMDGSEVWADQLLIPEASFERHDLSKPFRAGRRFDLVNCLEVAEHLRESRAEGFIGDLCRLGPVVIFSAAVPGQGGTHHVNEQWPSYWIPKFAAHGYVAFDCLRHRVWENREVAWWYVQNSFAFVQRDQIHQYPRMLDATRAWPTDVVHPRAYVRATVPSEMSPRMLKEVLRALPHFPGKVLEHLRG